MLQPALKNIFNVDIFLVVTLKIFELTILIVLSAKYYTFEK